MKLQIDRFVLEFDDSVKHERFECEDYRGVKFFENGYRYEILDCLLGIRLIVNHDDQLGFFKDMPFHEGTWGLLPSAVRVSSPSSSIGPG